MQLQNTGYASRVGNANTNKGGVGENGYFDQFKKVYPSNGSTLNPEVENWFINHPDEDAAAIIESAEQYDAFCRAEHDTYPHAQFIMKAINWLREKEYSVNWEEKKKSIKRKGPRHFTAEDTPDV